ncbi:hypothetical protein KI387_009651, partial [Taxus chinensis]
MEPVEGRQKLAKEIMTEKCYIGYLGEDQVLGILQYLPVKSVVAFGMTCRRFCLLTESEGLWAWICRREWGSRAVEAWLSSVGDQKLGWKALYLQMRALSSVFSRRLTQGEAIPSARASHSLNFISDTLVLFGGGCQGGFWFDSMQPREIGPHRPCRGDMICGLSSIGLVDWVIWLPRSLSK